MKRIILASFVIFGSVQALADGTRGGGDAVVRENEGVSLLDLVEPFEYRFFSPWEAIDPLEKTGSKLSKDGSLRDNLYLELLVAVTNPDRNLRKDMHQCWAEVQYVFSLLGLRLPFWQVSIDYRWEVEHPKALVWILTNEPLEQLNDEGSLREVDPASLVQVAIQKDGFVIVHEPSLEKMSDRTKIALFLHEALVRAVIIANPDLIKTSGTAPIRKFNKMLVERLYGGFVPDTVFIDTYRALGIPNLSK